MVLTNRLCLILLTASQIACNENKIPAPDQINSINLKKGSLITCGPENTQLGTLVFDISGSERIKEKFNIGVKLLHSFEYDEAEKVFANIIIEEPQCAMAYWGVAMSNFHPLWTPPSEPELQKGFKAIQIGQSLRKSKRESDYIEAIASFYSDWDKFDHRSRCIRFEQKMGDVFTRYPDDKEGAVFYALSINAAADPADKTFKKQKKAGAILSRLYDDFPNHPGVVHYIIHTYDSPELAKQALPAARRYASVAPSSAHALHMPSHIFTRLGLWDEGIQSNMASVDAAKCYAEQAGIKGHWDEELHGMDYLAYAYLQKGNNDRAKQLCDYLKTINEVYPMNFKVAYAFAAIPSRYLMENRLWNDASRLKAHDKNIPWEKFEWQRAIIHFTRMMGSVHTGELNAAEDELSELRRIHSDLMKQKDLYKANQVQIQINTGTAWILYKNGDHAEAVKHMRVAAEQEDQTEKHPVTPGEVIPARELLGDLFVQMKNWQQALQAYEGTLKKQPGRFNSLYGAGFAAMHSGQGEKANMYFSQLLANAHSISNRKEIIIAKQFIENHR